MLIKVWDDQGEEEVNVNWFRFTADKSDLGNELEYTTRDRAEKTVWSMTGVTKIEFGESPIVWAEIMSGPEDGKIVEPPFRW